MLTEKDLIQQLHKLKNIKPSVDWQKSHREILLKQIFGYQVELAENWMDDFSKKLSWAFMTNHLQPIVIVFFIALLVSGGGIFGVQAARNTKPGDSLYIAKIVSEKTQLALTFNEKDKAKLGIEFAGNRAQELDQVLAEPASGENQEKVDQLVSNFRTEIDLVKDRLAKISPTIKQSVADSRKPAAAETKTDDSAVFSADLGKDEKGLQLSDVPIKLQSAVKDETPIATPTPEIVPATTTPEIVPADTQKILDEAKNLLNNDDYSETLNKLDEASQIITQVNDAGQVKGESETASTSTVETKK